MKKMILIAGILFAKMNVQAQLNGQFKIRNDAFIQIGYQGYKTLTFGNNNLTSPNNGRFALEYCDGCKTPGFNLWKPWPDPLASNYLFFVSDLGNVGLATTVIQIIGCMCQVVFWPSVHFTSQI